MSGQVTAPATAASVIGSPEVTYSGATAGEIIGMDEAAFVPTRAAQITGAHNQPTVAGWATANSAVGPDQSDKQFFGPSTALPSSWASASNICYGSSSRLPIPLTGLPA